MNGMSKVMCMWVKNLRLRWKFRIDVLWVSVLHGQEMRQNVLRSQVVPTEQESSALR